MRIAIIGSGVAGLTVAHLLHPRHDLVVFEAGDHAGGHVHTHSVTLAGREWRVDSGFIVFNPRTYPGFVRLLDRLGVESRPTDMSFGVRCDRTGLEYCGTSLRTLFAQPANLFRPRFWGMLADVVRFNRESRDYLAGADNEGTMADFLAARGYSRSLIDRYVVPLGAALWSADPREVGAIPARTFLAFFRAQGFLQVTGLPPWRTVRGGSRTYVDRLIEPFRDRVRLGCPVASVRRHADGVDVQPKEGAAERFDEVVIAAHSDQALAMLADPTSGEREVLGAMRYQENDALLHTDDRVLPRRRAAWASWNYHVPREDGGRATLTYLMNRLQGLDAPERLCVTLNRDGYVDGARVLRRMRYAHPVHTRASVRARLRREEISGVHRTHYCGAYWGYGFHEDGVASGLAVARRFGAEL